VYNKYWKDGEGKGKGKEKEVTGGDVAVAQDNLNVNEGEDEEGGEKKKKKDTYRHLIKGTPSTSCATPPSLLPLTTHFSRNWSTPHK